MDGAKVALAILGAIVIYRAGKERAYGEIREAFGIEVEEGTPDVPYVDAQREAAPNQ